MLNPIRYLVAVAVDAESGLFFELTRGGTELLLILGAIFLIIVLIFFWVVAIRKPRHRHSRRHSPSPVNLKRYRQEQHEDEGLLAHFRSKHRRRKHRFHHRNPTLAETGGLPPARPTDAAPPPP